MFETNGWAKLMHEAIVIEMETNSEERKEYKEIEQKNMKGVRYAKILRNPSDKDKKNVNTMVTIGHEVNSIFESMSDG